MKTVRMRLIAVLTLAALCAALLAGCGETAAPAAPSDNEDAGGDTAEFVHVQSTEEFLKAIKPGAWIMIEPGVYNLTEYAAQALARNYELRTDGHEYVKFRECYDGAEIFIEGVSDLYITGSTEEGAVTELIVEPRYAAVLNFNDCDGLSLAYLTMGHTDTGECSGSVVYLSDCQNVVMTNMDLYGCGVYGIDADGATGDLTVFDSVIRDCSYGPFQFYNVRGKIDFYRCSFTGSSEGGWYYTEQPALLSFHECKFGTEESNTWLFRDDAIFDNCEWSEVTEYPDYEDYEDYAEDIEFDPDTMEAYKDFDANDLSGTGWVGYWAINPDSGEGFDLPYESDYGEMRNVYLYLGEDHGGSLSDFDGEHTITWEQNEDDSLALETEDGEHYTVTAYLNEVGRIWMLLQEGD
ncbi:MAG: right-handed parallel beta-helix repeat-containing protein, partial [Oscillibacter sp.]|nr:right-handed parallel beta-helix repeat-containing protein [Oscillibacter sp.]